MLFHQTEVKIVEKSLMLTARQVIEKYEGEIHKYNALQISAVFNGDSYTLWGTL